MQMLVEIAVVAQVLNTITLETRIICAPPTQEASAIFRAFKYLLGHLASKVHVSRLVIRYKNAYIFNMLDIFSTFGASYFLGRSTSWPSTLGMCSGTVDLYQTLHAAKEACEKNPLCMGVEDECGRGEAFGTCMTSITSSLCESIFYKRTGNI